MEVSTVSAPAISPTGGDLCEVDVTSMAIYSVTLLICLCGVAGNGAVLCLLHRNSMTLYVFDLASVDSLFLLLMVPSTLLYLLESMSCSTIMPLAYLRILFLLLCNFLQQLGYIAVSSQAVFQLTCITSSIKPFIYFLVGSCGRDMHSCRRHFSIQSLRKALHSIFGKPKETTAHSNAATMDTAIQACDPFPCSAEGPWDSGSGFP
uniref:G-protein coupled receptors family 1 profile domain-containing protein n=1 Tax=Chloebia gouldiae TaxID=44316 RepID=A0A3L8Q746_CHLGU|nr:hypothetical protein DV515_00018858 [Chloebia gouldiae]